MNDTFMKEKPVGPLLASMALPMVFSMLVNSLYNIVDSFFVAQISEQAMAALFRYVVVIMPTAYLLSHFMGPDGVWNAFWITEVFTTIVSVMIYHKTLKKA